MAKPTTEVVFRKYQDGEIIALFPYEIWSGYLVSSYMITGEHGGADYDHIISTTKPASPEEYDSMKNLLENRGYNLKAINRRNYSKYIKSVNREVQKRKTNG